MRCGWMTRYSAASAAVFVLGTVAADAQAPHPYPGREWARSTAAAEGIDPAPWARLDSLVRAGRFGNVDRILVVRNGRVVIDQAYPRDYARVAAGRRSHIGCGPGACEGFRSAPEFNYFDPETHPYHRGSDLHSLQSVTKSVMATLLGAVMQAGSFAGPQSPLLQALGSEARVPTDPRLARATVADLLTMRSGIEWHEQDRPLDSTNTTAQLEAAADWVRFTLSQPMEAEPGSFWRYNSGGSHLIGALVREATGRDPVDVARDLLFRPLGIEAFHWKRAGGGLPDGEGGLYLSAESLARIGYLYLRDGVWDGRRILPEGFVREATARHVTQGPPNGWGYGYQWWRLDREGDEIWAGLGFGGQFLLIIPAQELVVVANGWEVYGDRTPSLLGPLVQAARASVAGR